MARVASVVLVCSFLAGCADDEILHGLDERQANEVLVALDDAGIRGRKEREDRTDGGWVVSVPPRESPRAQRVLADGGLPRARPPGFGDVFSKGSIVPTPTEEHALYLHALGGELARTIEAIDGVVGARVHVGLPQADPLRPGERPPPRGSVLVRCRPASCETVRRLESGIRALVAGAADGLDPSAVSVVFAEATESSPKERPVPGRRSAVLVALAGAAALAAAAVGCAGFRARGRKGTTAP
jgi:type III secretion protein J